MTTKKVLLALAATSLLAFGATSPVYAEDPPPAAEGTKTQVPPDPDSVDPGEAMPDPGTDEGAGDAGAADSSSQDAGGSDSGGGSK